MQHTSSHRSPLFWFFRHTFYYQGGVGRALEMLSRSAKHDSALLVQRTERRLKITKKQSFFRCAAYSVCFVGRLEDADGATVLRGYFRPPLLLIWLMVGAAALQLLIVLDTFSLLGQSGAIVDFYRHYLQPSRTIGRIEAIAALASLVPLNLLGWMVELPAELRILGALQQSSDLPE